jgi:hypothetical protein
MASAVNIHLAVRRSGAAILPVGTGASGRSEPGPERNLTVEDGETPPFLEAAV